MTNLSEKPKKPYRDFPLHAHASGQWAKKIRGKRVYFGPWADPEAALRKYVDERDEWQAGVNPRLNRTGVAGGTTVRRLCNQYLTAQKAKVNSGELSEKSFADMHRTCRRILEFFGRDRDVAKLGPADFGAFRRSFPDNWSLTTIGNQVRRSRMVFLYASDSDFIPHKLNFGPDFREPGKRAKRIARQRKQQMFGLRMLESVEIRQLLQVSTSPLDAMILLGANCGLGQSDCAALPKSAIDFEKGWLDFPRPKTGAARRSPLWPETVTAVRTALTHRPNPKNDSDDPLVFLTRQGLRWVRDKVTDLPTGERRSTVIDSVRLAFNKRLNQLGLKRPGIGFYALRHGFETIAGQTGDQLAVDTIMGHVRGDMAELYCERIDDERLVSVSNHVHSWLFA